MMWQELQNSDRDVYQPGRSDHHQQQQQKRAQQCGLRAAETTAACATAGFADLRSHAQHFAASSRSFQSWMHPALLVCCRNE